MAAQEHEAGKEHQASAPPASSAAPDPLVGRTVDKYEIVRRIGRGGMGAVYEGRNTRIQKRVALKFIDAKLTSNSEAVERFQREAMAASAIESPHMVQVFDVGVTDDGVPYLVMELLPGRDLGKHLREVGRLELGPAVHVCSQILKALGPAHAAGIVHRDLKPDNVFLVEREGEVAIVKLLDFGVSKITGRDGVPLKTLTREGTVVGTPHYMSPEQAQGLADVDSLTDIYAVGAILYECLTGRPPHEGQSYEQVIVRICTQDVPDVRELAPEIPESIASVIARAMCRDRAGRYGSASDMLAALVEGTPEALRDKYLAGALSLGSLALRPPSGASGSGRRQRPLTPTEAAAVGSASTVAVTPADARAVTPGPITASKARPSSELTQAPSTLPSPAAAPSRMRAVLLVASGAVLVVVVLLLAGVLRVSVGGSPGDGAPSGTAHPSPSVAASAAGTAERAAGQAQPGVSAPSAQPVEVASSELPVATTRSSGPEAAQPLPSASSGASSDSAVGKHAPASGSATTAGNRAPKGAPSAATPATTGGTRPDGLWQ